MLNKRLCQIVLKLTKAEFRLFGYSTKNIHSFGTIVFPNAKIIESHF